jgi:hypothetical protein
MIYYYRADKKSGPEKFRKASKNAKKKLENHFKNFLQPFS